MTKPVVESSISTAVYRCTERKVRLFQIQVALTKIRERGSQIYFRIFFLQQCLYYLGQQNNSCLLLFCNIILCVHNLSFQITRVTVRREFINCDQNMEMKRSVISGYSWPRLGRTTRNQPSCVKKILRYSESETILRLLNPFFRKMFCSIKKIQWLSRLSRLSRSKKPKADFS